MRQTFVASSNLLDEIIKINLAWCTRDDLVTLLTLGKMEQIEKDHESNKAMAKVMTQLDLLIEMSW